MKRDIVGSNPARVEKNFRLLVRLAHTQGALGLGESGQGGAW